MVISKLILVAVPIAPLIGGIISGVLGSIIGRAGAHRVTILSLFLSTALSAFILFNVLANDFSVNTSIYVWTLSGGAVFEIGFLIDSLSATMMLVVTFVSLMVHIYTIGYMVDDPGYQRFFSFISLFTFAMLMLVMSNNFLQLFFGWEAVGLISYLLIGFWYKKPSAISANLKAFLVNRVGDLGFILGVGLILATFGTLDFKEVFELAPQNVNESLESLSGFDWSVISVICLLLFVGAMGKSAQVPLHVWLPDSMEGPTPISALIHAATMVTAGIFMVARMSPLFELSEAALSFVIIIGAVTALFTGLLGLVQNDIKRVVAYSTLSQLGYMTVALGASAYSVAMFHLVTHAFFKALLFLAAGSVIIGMHHQQNMQNMGGLRKYMPVTCATTLIGSLALIGFPFFSGFYSKESIIEYVYYSQIPGSQFAYYAVLSGVFVTALYTFRMYFLVFEGEERFGKNEPNAENRKKFPHESPAVILVPLILLAIPSILLGAILIEPMLYGDYFENSIFISISHQTLLDSVMHFDGWNAMGLHGFMTVPFALALGGIISAWILYVRHKNFSEVLKNWFKPFYILLHEKYYFDKFNTWFFVNGARHLGVGLWKIGDVLLIDNLLVNGAAKLARQLAGTLRRIQTGMIYHYALMMILGLTVLLSIWFFDLVRI